MWHFHMSWHWLFALIWNDCYWFVLVKHYTTESVQDWICKQNVCILLDQKSTNLFPENVPQHVLNVFSSPCLQCKNARIESSNTFFDINFDRTVISWMKYTWIGNQQLTAFSLASKKSRQVGTVRRWRLVVAPTTALIRSGNAGNYYFVECHRIQKGNSACILSLTTFYSSLFPYDCAPVGHPSCFHPHSRMKYQPHTRHFGLKR